MLLDKISGVDMADIDARIAAISDDINEYGFDKWGYSPALVRRSMSMLAWLYRRYWRVTCHGIDRIPAGRGLLIGNHSSQLAYDGLMVGTALFLEANPPRAVKAMIEKFFQHQPFVNVWMARTGQLTGLPENAVRLLEEDHLVMVFPEGARGGGKTVWKRYQLQGFGQGFMRLALRTRSPIIPFGFIGGEETCPSLVDLKPVAKLLGLPYAPVTPTVLPLPLPAKCSIHFGEPMHFEGTGDEEDEDILDKVEQVRAAVGQLIDEGLAARKGVFFG